MLNILYRDNYITVVIKPSGMLSEGEGNTSLPALLSGQLGAEVYPVHRLDRDTEGIMVYALSSRSAAVLSRDIVDGQWKKQYTALVCGTPDTPSGRLCDLLYYDRSRGRSYVVERMRKGVKEAVLDYTLLSFDKEKNISRLSVELQTGRTHQIRVQLASRGMALVGDRRYGAPAELGNTLCLCACRLSFLHPKTRERMEFSTEPSNF